MAENRAFSDENIPTKKDDYHGTVKYIPPTSPDITEKDVKSVNICISFEEAMKLSLAIQACLLSLNRYKRSTSAGKEMGLVLSLKTESNSITVIEAPVGSSRE